MNGYKIYVIFFYNYFESAQMEIEAFDTQKEASNWIIKMIKENKEHDVDVENFDVIVGQKRILKAIETEIVTEYDIEGVRE